MVVKIMLCMLIKMEDKLFQVCVISSCLLEHNPTSIVTWGGGGGVVLCNISVGKTE